MEDVLEIYSRPLDSRIPVVCMDEQPILLLADSREPIHLSQDNHTEKVDHEYIRCGTCNSFMFTEPLGGWRHVEITRTRTKSDWAKQIKWLVDEVYGDADNIILVCDNLNTHKLSSLYENFTAEEAFRLCQKIELHHTPKHGSWLNMAEIELSVFTGQCLNRRIDTIEALQKEASAWHEARNQRQKGINWQFTTDDARVKLKTLYPVIELKD